MIRLAVGASSLDVLRRDSHAPDRPPHVRQREAGEEGETALVGTGLGEAHQACTPGERSRTCTTGAFSEAMTKAASMRPCCNSSAANKAGERQQPVADRAEPHWPPAVVCASWRTPEPSGADGDALTAQLGQSRRAAARHGRKPRPAHRTGCPAIAGRNRQLHPDRSFGSHDPALNEANLRLVRLQTLHDSAVSRPTSLHLQRHAVRGQEWLRSAGQSDSRRQNRCRW